MLHPHVFKLYLLAQNIYTISNPSIPQTISIYHRDKIFNFPIVPPINYFTYPENLVSSNQSAAT